MKKISIAFLITSFTFGFAQKTSDLKFDTPISEAENQYIATESKTPKQYTFGYVYYDSMAGYSYRHIGEILSDENDNIILKKDPKAEHAFIIFRIENFALKVSKIPQTFIEKSKLEAEPEWLKFYKTNDTDQEKKLNRASSLNGGNAPQLALPILEKLRSEKFFNNKFYFELAFSYNALGKFPEAEQICDEAFKNNFKDELIYKEYIYSLLNQSKITETEKFIVNNISNFKIPTYKAEAISNLILHSSHKKRNDIAKKWLIEFKKEFDTERYKKQIELLESTIQKNDTTSS
ncbi:hypothetical protein [Amniculibacterium sp. G2-70]|jgi:hypothetical protein|uniref:hypothetical protein n=1 Tax=Amniculibacterium sp. G2-70 TaxID=2767188 RepID=UPI001654192D|nr:hypothetical protein [Amniculibacterium sp. G2-70]